MTIPTNAPISMDELEALGFHMVDPNLARTGTANIYSSNYPVLYVGILSSGHYRLAHIPAGAGGARRAEKTIQDPDTVRAAIVTWRLTGEL